MQRGLIIVENLGCLSIVVETDSLELVEAFNGVIEIWSPYTAILMECFLIARRIGQVKIQHCSREENMVAHELARQCFVSNISCNWVDEPPSFILDKLLKDVTFMDA